MVNVATKVRRFHLSSYSCLQQHGQQRCGFETFERVVPAFSVAPVLPDSTLVLRPINLTTTGYYMLCPAEARPTRSLERSNFTNTYVWGLRQRQRASYPTVGYLDYRGGPGSLGAHPAGVQQRSSTLTTA
jgi:hypothetical protein